MIRVNVFCQRSLRSRAALVSIALAASALVVQAQVFSAPKNLSNNGTAEFGQIAVDPSGNINVVWDESGNFDIFFSRSTDGGGHLLYTQEPLQQCWLFSVPADRGGFRRQHQRGLGELQ